MNLEEQARKMRRIIAKAWGDEAFRLKLLSNPAAVLKGEGVEMPAGIEARAVENTDKLFHLVIPPKPAVDELNDEQLKNVAGGSITFHSKTMGDF